MLLDDSAETWYTCRISNDHRELSLLEQYCISGGNALHTLHLTGTMLERRAAKHLAHFSL